MPHYRGASTLVRHVHAIERRCRIPRAVPGAATARHEAPSSRAKLLSRSQLAGVDTVSTGILSTSRPLRRSYSSRATGIASYDDSTIFALSSAPGRAAIAIIRCSGPACMEIYRSLCPVAPEPKPRHATLRRLHAPSGPEPLSILDPGALILCFPAPATVTGEDVLELHIHGGRATVRAVLSAISSLSTPQRSIRPAEAGEFTQRAFYNDRLDLTQVEALGDTLAAETETQRALAAQGAGTGAVLRKRYEAWRKQLLEARGELEALIDFSEDQHFEDSPAELARGVAEKVEVLIRQVEASMKNAARGELLRNGIKVALLGAPNAGKSSLLNRIVGRDAAIVSSTAGTTRDIVETNVDIGGFFCNLGDLAGIRSSGRTAADVVGDIEEEGIRRAKARALEADVVVVVHSIERRANGTVGLAFSPDILSTIEMLDHERQQIVHVVNKIDLLPQAGQRDVGPRAMQLRTLLGATQHAEFTQSLLAAPEAGINWISCSDTQEGSSGIGDLLATLTARFQALTDAVEIPGISSAASGYEESLGASERQARLLERCRDNLQEFLQMVEVPEGDGGEDIDIVLAAESLREAARCFARMTGEGSGGDVEDVLGVVFEKFCVGK